MPMAMLVLLLYFLYILNLRNICGSYHPYGERTPCGNSSDKLYKVMLVNVYRYPTS
jgi:hypothetical protein